MPGVRTLSSTQLTEAALPVDARPIPANSSHSRTTAVWVALLSLPLAALAVTFVPVWLIHPFTSQSPAELELSYMLRAAAAPATIIALLGALAAAVYLWMRSRRWWQRSTMVLWVTLASAGAWFAQQNHFEWMFAPLAVVEFAPANTADFIEDSAKVLAVELNGDAAAYPLRQLAYHHVVQDDVGGVPIAVTY